MKRQTLEMQALERRWVDRLASMLLSPLLRGERLSDGWRALSWDAEQGLCLTLVRGDCTLLIELERRDASRDCYAPAFALAGCRGSNNAALSRRCSWSC